jgi:hypothetical protein
MLSIRMSRFTVGDDGKTTVAYSIYDGGFRDITELDMKGSKVTTNRYAADTIVIQGEIEFNATLKDTEIEERLIGILKGYAESIGSKVKPDYLL